MRGKLSNRHASSCLLRITPAYAGKTSPTANTLSPKPDHPRVCGENPVLHDFRAVGTGSPPRMRGKLSFSRSLLGVTRITPAYAGKTANAAATAKWHRDHPRVCGENRGSERIMHWATGSPPRMRGKQAEVDGMAVEYRITPAYAGKTSCHGLHASDRRDHPRVCGENHGALRAGLYPEGSPPRMRGKRKEGKAMTKFEGITPAYAGKTASTPIESRCT